MAQERRHSQRIALDSPVRVLLDKSENGFLLDVGDGGLAVCELGPSAPGQVVPFEFDLPEGSGRIQGRAEIVWKSASGRRTGLQFVEMDDPCRERLGQWISTQTWTMRIDGVEREPREPAAAAQAAEPPASPAIASSAEDGDRNWMLASAASPANSGSEPRNAMPENATELWSMVTNDVKSTPAIGVGFAALVLAVTFGFLFYHSRGARAGAEAKNAAPPVELPDAIPAAAPEASTGVSTAASAPVAPALPSKPPIAARTLDGPGVVLQVGALTHEAYANALANDLKRKNLPAFVFRREGDNFYRVAVGPFSDKESPVRVKGELEKQGLKPFVRVWDPKVESARN